MAGVDSRYVRGKVESGVLHEEKIATATQGWMIRRVLKDNGVAEVGKQRRGER